MDAQRDRVLHWICTGEHVIKTDYQKPPKGESEPYAEFEDYGGGSAGSSSSSSLSTRLIGAEDDPLIPAPADIRRVFHAGRATWSQLVRTAESVPRHDFPPGLNDPSIMLKDVPALPSRLPGRNVLVGQPLWHAPDPKPEPREEGAEGLDFQFLHGLQKHLWLAFPAPIQCRLSARVARSSGQQPWASQRGLAMLTLCWSYILCARLLELQGKQALYSRHALQPVIAKTLRPRKGHAVVDLGDSASDKLVRWLCAVLAPKPGWGVPESRSFLPWATVCTGDTSFVILTSKPRLFDARERPPNAAEATALLIELCALFGFGGETAEEGVDKETNMSPPTAAFLAALCLPFCRNTSLQPHFFVSSLRRRSGTDNSSYKYIRQYVVDLRRPRVALWWLGILLLGDTTVLDWIARYLETAEERWGFGSMAPPDTAAAAWTGSPQSFLDDESSRPYQDPTDSVSWEDVLRHRYNWRIRDEPGRTLSWRPFGSIAKSDIEPELWPWIERGHRREYVHWVWWIKRDKDVRRDIQMGFRKDTGRFRPDVHDRLEMMWSGQSTEACDDIKLAPSMETTRRMISYCSTDVSGDRDLSNLGLVGIESHRWLDGYR